MPSPSEPPAETPTPLYWVRQRGGELETVRLNADEAEMIAQRPGAKGSHLRPAGLVWREPDPTVRGGYVFYTLTPVFKEPRSA